MLWKTSLDNLYKLVWKEPYYGKENVFAYMKIYDLSRTVKELSAFLIQNEAGSSGIGIKQNSLEDYFFKLIYF